MDYSRWWWLSALSGPQRLLWLAISILSALSKLEYNMLYSLTPFIFRLTYHSCVSSPPELQCARWASFCWKPELSAETWPPQLNPSAERSDPHDLERGSLPEKTHHSLHPANNKEDNCLLEFIWMLNCNFLSLFSVQTCKPGKNTWNIFCKLHQNLNLACCHFRQ